MSGDVFNQGTLGRGREIPEVLYKDAGEKKPIGQMGVGRIIRG